MNDVALLIFCRVAYRTAVYRFYEYQCGMVIEF